MRMSWFVSPRWEKTKEKENNITTATDCCWSMVLAQSVRMKRERERERERKQKKTNNLLPKYTHAHKTESVGWCLLKSSHTHKERKISPFRKQEDIN